MRTYTLTQSELDIAATLVTLTANTQGVASVLGAGAPVQPISVDLLSAGWLGAQEVRVVAHYQDAASIGYASLADLESDHEWTAEIDPDWHGPCWG